MVGRIRPSVRHIEGERNRQADGLSRSYPSVLAEFDTDHRIDLLLSHVLFLSPVHRLYPADANWPQRVSDIAARVESVFGLLRR